MTKKSKRLRGSNTHGRGYRKSIKAGSRGGTGLAGSFTHKRISSILAVKKLEKSRKITNIRDIESKLDRYIAKKFVTKKLEQTTLGEQVVYIFSKKLASKYKKILSVGEPSGKYVLPRQIKCSKITLKKIN